MGCADIANLNNYCLAFGVLSKQLFLGMCVLCCKCLVILMKWMFCSIFMLSI